MEEFLLHLNSPHAIYAIIFGVIILSGFGAPIPEDLPIMAAGYFCGKEDPITSVYIMLPLLFVAIIGADGIVFFLGRKYGHHVPKLPLFRRFLTEQRLKKTEAMLNKHGGKFIFVARFLPGMRAPAFFTAGIFKLPYWKFLLFDGTAALLSVPFFFFIAYALAEEFDHAKKLAFEYQIFALIAIVVIVVAVVLIKKLFKKLLSRSGVYDS